MQISELTKKAQDVVNAYLNLSTKGHTIPCPYYNNKHVRVRGALRVNVGKGSPSEIVQEAHLIAMRDKVDLGAMGTEDIKRFLVDHNLGVDCSAFVYYVLGAEVLARTGKKLARALKFPNTLNPARALLRKLRTAENTNVAVLADDANSRAVELANIQAGDMIVMLNTGDDHARNHVLLIHKVENMVLHYTHSLQWRTDGTHAHGVRKGEIHVISPDSGLNNQKWIEQGKTGKENETHERARKAERLEIRRLRIL